MLMPNTGEPGVMQFTIPSIQNIQTADITATATATATTTATTTATIVWKASFYF